MGLFDGFKKKNEPQKEKSEQVETNPAESKPDTSAKQEEISAPGWDAM